MDKATLIQKLADLKTPSSAILEEYSAAAKTTFTEEIGLKHPSLEVGLHIRDDGSLEIFAGKAKIILDSDTGSLIMTGNHMVGSFSDSNLLLSESNSLAINNTPLDFKWLDYSLKSKAAGLVDISPVTFKNTGSKNSQYITGTPTQGQRLVSFSDVFNSRPLFKEPENADYIKSLQSLLEEVL